MASSFLRWAGSKRQALAHLRPFWGAGYRRYVEPFVGSGALFFDLEPEKALLGDVNRDLIDTLTAVRDCPARVSAALKRIGKGRESYYQLRGRDPSSMGRTARAARFIFLNRYCFNGLYRTNLQGQFNVPYSPSRTGTLPTLRELKELSNVLLSATIRVADFETLLASCKHGDFVYLDPPFAIENRRVFHQYNASTFGLSDLDRLRGALMTLDAAGVHFVLSYALCKEALDFFSSWPNRRIQITRHIAGFAAHRRKAHELLISNSPKGVAG